MSCARIFSYIMKGAPPVKGRHPNTQMYTHTPSAHMSISKLGWYPEVRDSGDRKAGVLKPGQCRMLNIFSLPAMMLLPKSAILTLPLLLSSRRLAGLRSPWTTLWVCR